MGRPTELTPALKEEIVKIVREGNYFSVAAACCGVSTKTLYNWIERGDNGEEPYETFVHALKTAAAQAEQESVRIGKEGGPGWQASFRFLESRARKRWGKRLDDEDRSRIAQSVADQFRDDREKRKRSK